MTTLVQPPPAKVRDGAHLRLRAATAGDHARVDEAFARYDLAEPASYAAFLTAHARVLPSVERAVDPGALLHAWKGRTGALSADLAALGHALPEPTPFAVAGEAARWGALYVIEGSRLGGALLARRVGAGLPHAYLSATHGPGAWRALLAALDAAAEAGGEGWIEDATDAARATFDAYASAAGEDANRLHG